MLGERPVFMTCVSQDVPIYAQTGMYFQSITCFPHQLTHPAPGYKHSKDLAWAFRKGCLRQIQLWPRLASNYLGKDNIEL